MKLVTFVARTRCRLANYDFDIFHRTLVDDVADEMSSSKRKTVILESLLAIDTLVMLLKAHESLRRGHKLFDACEMKVRRMSYDEKKSRWVVDTMLCGSHSDGNLRDQICNKKYKMNSE